MTSFWETLTLETDSSNQKAEFVKKYKGCYVFLQTHKDKEVKQLVYFSRYDAEEEQFWFSTTNEKLTYKIGHDTEAVISAAFPEPTLISLSGRLMYFTRVPMRQYRKAPCNDNCLAIDVVGSFISQKQWFPSTSMFSLEALTEAYAPTYIDLPAAATLLFHEDTCSTGMPITKDFGLSLSPSTDKELLLWYRTIPVAVVLDDKHIQVKVPEFEQEVFDLIQRNNYNFRIVH